MTVHLLAYLLLFAVFLFLPGWCLVRLLTPGLSGWLTGFAFSLALLMANVLLFVHFGIPLTAFTPAVILQTLALATWLGLAVGFRREARRAAAHFARHRAFHAGALLTILAISIYLAFAGMYTEVPADVWRHLGYIQWAHESLTGDRSALAVNTWYYIPAWFRYLAGGDVFEFIAGFGAANTLVQGLGIYVFTHHIARRLVPGPARAAAIAGLSVPFAAFAIGVDVFSYARYYTFGPMQQNMLVYFCCVLLLLEIFERRRIPPRAAASLAVLSLLLYVVHDQEAAFLFAFGLALAAFTLVSHALRWARRDPAPPGAPPLDLYLAAGIALAAAALFLYSHYTLPIRGAVLPWIVPVSGFLPFDAHLYVANPAYQVFQSITVWGVLVYVLFLAHWKTFRRSPYIVCGMLIPVLTVFNPVFVDMFLRYSEAAPIYRFIYAAPLYMVAACCLIGYVEAVARGGALKKAAAASTGILLIVTLFPNDLPVLHNSNSRAATLAPVPPGNDSGQWRDLFELLRGIEETRIITDPVTAYMLRGLTRHTVSGYKFHQAHVPLDRDADYYLRMPGGLIVINERDGAPSANGRRAGHWPEDVLALSRYYPPSLKRVVASRPDRFQQIWSRNRIHVYRIRPAP